jgi:hypothetical protein
VPAAECRARPALDSSGCQPFRNIRRPAARRPTSERNTGRSAPADRPVRRDRIRANPPRELLDAITHWAGPPRPRRSAVDGSHRRGEETREDATRRPRSPRRPPGHIPFRCLRVRSYARGPSVTVLLTRRGVSARGAENFEARQSGSDCNPPVYGRTPTGSLRTREFDRSQKTCKTPVKLGTNASSRENVLPAVSVNWWVPIFRRCSLSSPRRIRT